MATFSKEYLSGTPATGRNISITTIVTAGDLIHTATAVAGQTDEVWLYATNNSATARLLTIEWGGVLAADQIQVEVPANTGVTSGPIQIVPGWPLSGGLEIRAFAALASVIVVSGFVNRITP